MYVLLYSLTMIRDIDSEIREADDMSDDNGVSVDSCLTFQDNYETEDACLHPDWISYGYTSFLTVFFLVHSDDLFHFK